MRLGRGRAHRPGRVPASSSSGSRAAWRGSGRASVHSQETAQRAVKARDEARAEWKRWEDAGRDLAELRTGYFYDEAEGVQVLRQDLQKIFAQAGTAITDLNYGYSELEKETGPENARHVHLLGHVRGLEEAPGRPRGLPQVPGHREGRFPQDGLGRRAPERQADAGGLLWDIRERIFAAAVLVAGGLGPLRGPGRSGPEAPRPQGPARPRQRRRSAAGPRHLPAPHVRGRRARRPPRRARPSGLAAGGPGPGRAAVLHPEHHLPRVDQVRRPHHRPRPARRPDPGRRRRATRSRPGYRVVGVTAEAIVVQGPNGERRTFAQTRRPAMKKTALILALALAAGACRTISLDYQQGVKAEMNQNYDEAIQYYQKAALSHPNDSAYRLALFRARASATLYYLQTARHPGRPEQEEGGRGQLPEGPALRSPELHGLP
ncbi:MAG: hypothetical protein M0C28_15425 [Candidatus Moduliflexus flocculans]|nr:hypothetical protein [Candidatus Moduliflexus flocculans]